MHGHMNVNNLSFCPRFEAGIAVVRFLDLYVMSAGRLWRLEGAMKFNPLG